METNDGSMNGQVDIKFSKKRTFRGSIVESKPMNIGYPTASISSPRKKLKSVDQSFDENTEYVGDYLVDPSCRVLIDQPRLCFFSFFILHRDSHSFVAREAFI